MSEEKSFLGRIIDGELAQVEAEARANTLPQTEEGLRALLQAKGFGATNVTEVAPPEYLAAKTAHLSSGTPVADPFARYLKVHAEVGTFGLYFSNVTGFPEHHLDLTDTGVRAEEVEPGNADTFGVLALMRVDPQVCAVTLDLKNVARFAVLLETAKDVAEARKFIASVEIE